MLVLLAKAQLNVVLLKKTEECMTAVVVPPLVPPSPLQPTHPSLRILRRQLPRTLALLFLHLYQILVAIIPVTPPILVMLV